MSGGVSTGKHWKEKFIPFKNSVIANDIAGSDSLLYCSCLIISVMKGTDTI